MGEYINTYRSYVFTYHVPNALSTLTPSSKPIPSSGIINVDSGFGLLP
jgi:hypothetical protein